MYASDELKEKKVLDNVGYHAGNSIFIITTFMQKSSLD